MKKAKKPNKKDLTDVEIPLADRCETTKDNLNRIHLREEYEEQVFEEIGWFSGYSDFDGEEFIVDSEGNIVEGYEIINGEEND